MISKNVFTSIEGFPWEWGYILCSQIFQKEVSFESMPVWKSSDFIGFHGGLIDWSLAPAEKKCAIAYALGIFVFP
ncbi:MAG: hypothetical protein KDC80_19060 [Saprospiraceae bacterium]|nr:hypothetical protein [Saprospiraceae bacterium]